MSVYLLIHKKRWMKKGVSIKKNYRFNKKTKK